MKIAVVQLNSCADVQANLVRILSLLDKAVAQQRPDMIALPEYALCLTSDRAASIAGAQEPDASLALTALSAFARTQGVYLHLGSCLEKSSDGKYYNSSLVFDKSGQRVSSYRKINLFRVDQGALSDSVVHNEASLLSPGHTLETFRIGKLLCGNTICYDLRFPELYEKLRQQGCQIIMAPSAFTEFTGRRDWSKLLRARAIESGCYMIAANQCGSFDNGRHTSWGHSMIVDPSGNILAECGHETGIITAELEPLDNSHTG